MTQAQLAQGQSPLLAVCDVSVVFGGIIALNGSMPRRGGPLLRLPEVRSLKVLIGHGIANAVVPLSMVRPPVFTKLHE